MVIRSFNLDLNVFNWGKKCKLEQHSVLVCEAYSKQEGASLILGEKIYFCHLYLSNL